MTLKKVNLSHENAGNSMMFSPKSEVSENTKMFAS